MKYLIQEKGVSNHGAGKNVCNVEEKSPDIYRVRLEQSGLRPPRGLKSQNYTLRFHSLNPYLICLDEEDGTVHYLFWEKVASGHGMASDHKDHVYHINVRGFSLYLDVSKYYEKRVREEKQVRPEHITIESPIPGLVTKIGVALGDRIDKGKWVLSLSAMKLENEILSPETGEVLQILVKESQQVDKGQPLVVIKALST